MESELPPSYDDDAGTPNHGKRKGGYEALSMQEVPQALPMVHEHTDSVSPASLHLRAADGVYTGLADEDRDEERLYNFLSAQAVVAPHFHLKVTGYKEHDIQAFSFTIPLPRMHPIQATLFTKADDCPSFHSSCSRTTNDGEAGKRLQNVDSTWSVHYTKGPEVHCRSTVDGEVSPASEDTINHWNTRRGHNLIPPWVPLSQDFRDESSTHQLDIADSKDHAQRVKQSLQRYLAPAHGTDWWSRWLIVPQMSYGWDRELIQSELDKLVPTGFFNFSSLSRIGVEIVNPRPSLAVHLLASKRLGKTYRNLLASMDPNSPLIISISIFSIFFSFYAALLSFSKGWNFTGFILVCEIILVFALVTKVRCIMNVFAQRESVDDSIGLAWALKGWIYTGVPESYSRSEALTEVRRLQPSLCTSADESVILQRRSNGWYLLAGTREGDWLSANRENLERAIKNQVNGTVDTRLDNEINLVRARAGMYEGDDPVGVQRDPSRSL